MYADINSNAFCALSSCLDYVSFNSNASSLS
nr:MAG TPA: hypothetical protein [Caudoviricetes sp.]